MITPWPHQIPWADESEAIIRKHGLVYINGEERTGKTLTGLLVAERLPVDNIAIITKKKALEGWQDTLKNWQHEKIYHLTNYHSVGKLRVKPQLVILDEAHSYISGYPKRSNMWVEIRDLVYGLPLIYMSATSSAQGRQLLFNQLALSKYSPFAKYKDYYEWYKEYADRDEAGKLRLTYINAMLQAIDYSAVQHERIWNEVKHLFTVRTRKELGFEHEPEDKLHFITLSPAIKNIYNILVDKKVLSFTHSETGKDYTLVCDTPTKLRFALHMLEGGSLKIDDEYISLGNREKLDYIKNTWGDAKDMVIMYQYIAEGIKLRREFKYATILQGTSYAEGVDLSMYKHLIIYSQDFSTAKHTQRRARQANKERKEEIDVHYLLVKGAASHNAYKTVSINKQNYVDTVFERI